VRASRKNWRNNPTRRANGRAAWPWAPGLQFPPRGRTDSPGTLPAWCAARCPARHSPRRAAAPAPGVPGLGRAALGGAARAVWPLAARAGIFQGAPGAAGKAGNAAGGQRLTGAGKPPFFPTSFANPLWSISTRGEGWLGKVRVPWGVSQAPWGTPQGWRSDTSNPQQASGNYREVTTGYQLQERLGTPHQSLGGGAWR